MVRLKQISPQPQKHPPAHTLARWGRLWRAWDKGLGQFFCQLAVIIMLLILPIAWLQPGAYAGDPRLTYIVPLFASLGLLSLILPFLWLGATLVANLWAWLETPAGARVVRLLGRQLPALALGARPHQPATAQPTQRRQHARRLSTRLPFALFGYAPLLTAP